MAPSTSQTAKGNRAKLNKKLSASTSSTPSSSSATAPPVVLPEGIVPASSSAAASSSAKGTPSSSQLYSCEVCGFHKALMKGEAAMRTHADSDVHRHNVSRAEGIRLKKVAAEKRKAKAAQQESSPPQTSSPAPAPAPGTKSGGASTGVVVLVRQQHGKKKGRRSLFVPIASSPSSCKLSFAPRITEAEHIEAAEKALRRYGPLLRPVPARPAHIDCTVCSDCRMQGRDVEAHFEGQRHRDAVARQRRLMAEEQKRARARMLAPHSRMAIAYAARSDEDAAEGLTVECPRPAMSGTIRAPEFTNIKRFHFPSDLRALFAILFPSRNDLVNARVILDAFACANLIKACDWWNPCAPAGRITEQEGKSHAMVCSALRALWTACISLQETSNAIELSGYNRCDRMEAEARDDDEDDDGDAVRVAAAPKMVYCRVIPERHGPAPIVSTTKQKEKAKGALPQRTGQCLYSVKMPGVSENRPSVIRGDVFFLRAERQSPGPSSSSSSSPAICRYEASVHFVNEDSIVFAMPEDFTVDKAMFKYSIVFKPSTSQASSLLYAVENTPAYAFLLLANCDAPPQPTMVSPSISFRDMLARGRAAGGDAASRLVLANGSSSSPHATPVASLASPTPPPPPPSSSSTTVSVVAAARKGLEAVRCSLNAEQRAFMGHVGSERRFSCLWGPPGTGKTRTMVAAVIDTVLSHYAAGGGDEDETADDDDDNIDDGVGACHRRRPRILICAPSNDAADLIAERIVEDPAMCAFMATKKNIPPRSWLLRIPGLSRDPKSVPLVLSRYCPDVVDSVFAFPTKDDIMLPSIVVTTLMTSAHVHFTGVERDHFTHLFVDEAGHSSEALLMVGLNTAGGRRTKVVLAGDHKQLGPFVTVPALVRYQMHHSPLLRVYNDPAFWQAVGHQLLVCYRSHPAIVRIVNACYADKLRSIHCRDGDSETAWPENAFALLWSTPVVENLWREHCRRLERKKNAARSKKKGAGGCDSSVSMTTPPPVAVPLRAPLLLINHSYPDSQEKGSPSWMNAREVTDSVALVFALFDSRQIQSFDEVAIISPYKKQVEKIRNRIWGLMYHGERREELRPLMVWENPQTGRPLKKPLIPMRVSTVDSFQGREARVVIVSCVRSSAKACKQDSRFGLGFLSQPERSNVALSRAKELLIVLGNRRVLGRDARWAEYMRRFDEMGEGAVMNVGGPADDADDADDSPDDDTASSSSSSDDDEDDDASVVDGGCVEDAAESRGLRTRKDVAARFAEEMTMSSRYE